MANLIVRTAGAGLLLATLLTGCGKLRLDGQPPHSTQLPTPKQLKPIRYMSQSQTPGPDGRRLFDHLDQAKSCHDLEIAMRWNRPADIKTGPFNDKLVYVSSAVPADLAKNSEVFVSGVIKAGRSLPSGGSIWSLKLKDGSELQAIETPDYYDKQAEAQQSGGPATMIHPFTPGRTLCAYGVYQGNIGLAMDNHGHVPLLSLFFAMDRYR
jgi:hypothetical protein